MGAMIEWLTDPANWVGSDGIWLRTLQHVQYSLVTLLIASIIAIPLGLWIGHTGKGRVLVVNLVNGMRSVPTLGLLFAAVLIVGPMIRGDLAFLAPSIFVLVVLAIPPVLAGAYSGVEEVDRAARDAAKGMGMTSRQVLRDVEIPCAMPLIFSGVRSAALQVIATATVAASVSIGGLGRFLIDGLAFRDYGMMAGGAVLVGVLALIIDFVFALVQRLAVSPGLRPGTSRRRGRSSRGGNSAGSSSGASSTTSASPDIDVTTPA